MQNRLDLWFNTQKFIQQVIYELLEHVSPKVDFYKVKERKLQTNICYENTSKPNPAICKRESTPWPSGLPSQEQQIHLIIRKSTHAVYHIHCVKERNHVIMGKDEESDEIHNPFVLKNMWQIWVKRNLPHLIKRIRNTRSELHT